MAKAKKASEIAGSLMVDASKKMSEAKHPGGRPTKYLPELCDQFLNLSADGWSKEEICWEWRISHQTFYDWQARHPEFLEAVKRGTQLSKGWWMSQARKNLNSLASMPFNSVLWSMNMRCRFGMTEDHLPHVPKFAKAKSIKEKAQALTEALSKGEIAPSQANLALDAVTKEANLIEKSDHAKRIEALEAKAAKKEKKGVK